MGSRTTLETGLDGLPGGFTFESSVYAKISELDLTIDNRKEYGLETLRNSRCDVTYNARHGHTYLWNGRCVYGGISYTGCTKDS